MGMLLPMLICVAVLYFLRGVDIEGAPISLGAMNMPSLIGMNIVFGGIVTMVSALVMDRVSGTLLRAKSMPGGMTGYLIGHLGSTAMFLSFTTLVLLVVGLPLFDGLEFATPDRWLLFLAVLAIGLVAVLPLGAVLGSLINDLKNMSLVIFPVIASVAVSGIFYKITALPEWLQWIGQALPMYWMGLGMRQALLPDSMAAVEIGGEWRTLTMFAVLALWAVISMALAPRLLRRMSRRESGSAVAARRQLVQQQWG
ncbi:ABC transporter permease [Glycomyces buryatensis]|uniref:ABC transporter permease n=2 Tax=Glycomyces buryatensis TaxID=2570927 RepID=A0A4V4HSP1_9ACTN|nr:ABC transporter permease [Glycomyces buryatensis]